MMNENEQMNLNGYGELLSKLLRDNNISVSNLRTKLNLSSRTSIARILKNECRAETVRRFHRILTDHRAQLPFDDDDYSSLASALEITCKGRLSALVNWHMKRMVDGFNETDGALPPLTEQLLSYRGADEVRIYIVNCCDESVANALIRLKRELTESDGQRYSIRQFIRGVWSDGLNAGFLRLYPLLTWERYRALCDNDRPATSELTDAIEAPHVCDAFDALTNYMVILCRNGNETHVDFMYMSCKNRPDGVYGIKDRLLYRHMRQFFGSLEESCTPLNTVVELAISPDGKSLECGSRLLEEAESSWQTILLKPDICIHQISPEIVRRVLTDSPMSPDPAAIEALVEVQRRRYGNYLDPSRHEIIILSRDGLERFAATGTLTDHPVGAAALKTDEVIRVLSDLVEAERHIGGFYVYVTNGRLDCSIKLCGSDRMFISDVARPGSLCIVRSSLVKQLTEYIFNRLIPEQAMSREDSIKYILGLIDSLRGAQG